MRSSRVRLALLAWILAAIAAACSGRDGQSGAGSIEGAKAATAFVVVGRTGHSGSGSGFLVHRQGRSGLVVTNAHVTGGGRGKVGIRVVFHSGTSRALALEARLVAHDPVADLALLEVEGDALPEPIPIEADRVFRETDPVLILGFPFGMELTTNRESPSLTVSRGSVSSLRLDENDQPFMLQIDGDINPGNSGGPIIDEQGRLAGVSVAEVSSTNIGFAIPAFMVRNLLEGTVTGLRASRSASGIMLFGLPLEPTQKIERATLRLAEKSTAELQAFLGPAQRWKEIEDAPQTVELTRVGDAFTATFQAPASRRGVPLCAQIVLETGGRRNAMPPFRMQLDEGAVVLFGPGVATRPEKHPSGPGREPAKPRPDPPAPQPPPPAPAPEPEVGTVLTTTSSIEDVVPIGVGESLLLLSEEPRLALFDRLAEKIAAAFPLGVDFPLLAATRESLYVVDTQKRVIHRRKLADMTPLATAPVGVLGEVRAVAIGSNSTDAPLVLAVGEALQLYDPLTLKQLPTEWRNERGENRPPYIGRDTRLQLRASPNGRYLTFWRLGVSPSGVHLIRLRGGVLEFTYQHTTMGHLVPDDSGNVLTGQNVMYNNQLQKVDEPSQPSQRYVVLVPVLGKDLFLRVMEEAKQATAVVYKTRGGGAVMDLGVLPLMKSSEHPAASASQRITLEKRYFLDPDSGQLVLIPRSNDRIVIREIQPLEVPE